MFHAFVSIPLLGSAPFKYVIALHHLVEGRVFGDMHLENNVARTSLQLSASVTLYILQMNFSTDLTVESSRSPFSRFLSSMWCSVNVFHDVFLLWPAN